jgi:hypothetical protein
MLATARIRPPRLYVTAQSRELNAPSMSMVSQVSAFPRRLRRPEHPEFQFRRESPEG